MSNWELWKLSTKDVESLVRGLEIIVPDLLALDSSGKVIVSTSIRRIAAAITEQLEELEFEAGQRTDSRETI